MEILIIFMSLLYCIVICKTEITSKAQLFCLVSFFCDYVSQLFMLLSEYNQYYSKWKENCFEFYIVFRNVSTKQQNYNCESQTVFSNLN